MTDAEEWWDGLSPKQKNEVWLNAFREAVGDFYKVNGAAKPPEGAL